MPDINFYKRRLSQGIMDRMTANKFHAQENVQQKLSQGIMDRMTVNKFHAQENIQQRVSKGIMERMTANKFPVQENIPAKNFTDQNIKKLKRINAMGSTQESRDSMRLTLNSIETQKYLPNLKI